LRFRLARGDLAQESVALCHQVTTLDRAKLAALLGSLTIAHLREVEEGLRIALGMV
jgi:mRNA-degrading endonuclease toxin of MazEF toxin-antitoxin module